MTLRNLIDTRKILLNMRAQQQAAFERKLTQVEKAVENVVQAHFTRERDAVLKLIRKFPLDELVSQQARVKGTSPIELFAQDRIRVELRFIQNAELNTTLSSRLEASMRGAAQASAQQTAVRLGAEFPGFPDEAQTFLDNHIPQLVGRINRESLRQVTNVISTGITEGVGRQVMAERIRGIYRDMDRSRVLKIARTEAGMAMSVSERAIVDRLPNRGQIMKSWLTARDERVRPTHNNMQTLTDPAFGGVAIPLDSNYSNGLQYPRDPSGRAREIIQCRCSQIYSTDPNATAPGAPAGAPEELGVREQLSSEEITSQKRRSGDNMNGVDNIVLKSGQRAMFKGVKGEYQELRRTIRTGNFYKREIVASDVAELIGYEDLVPTTVKRTIGGDVGSMQKFVPNAETASDSIHSLFMVEANQLDRSAVYDLLMGNTDRHGGNYMLGNQLTAEGNATLHLIDNGLILPGNMNNAKKGVTDFFRSKNFESAGFRSRTGGTDAIPDSMKAPWRDNKDAILKAMADGDIDNKAINAFEKRLDIFLEEDSYNSFTERILDPPSRRSPKLRDFSKNPDFEK